MSCNVDRLSGVANHGGPTWDTKKKTKVMSSNVHRLAEIHALDAGAPRPGRGAARAPSRTVEGVGGWGLRAQGLGIGDSGSLMLIIHIVVEKVDLASDGAVSDREVARPQRKRQAAKGDHRQVSLAREV